MRYRLRTLLIVIAAMSVGFAYLRAYQDQTVSRWGSCGGRKLRVYDARWKATFFKPAATLESTMTGFHISTAIRTADGLVTM